MKYKKCQYHIGTLLWNELPETHNLPKMYHVQQMDSLLANLPHSMICICSISKSRGNNESQKKVTFSFFI